MHTSFFKLSIVHLLSSCAILFCSCSKEYQRCSGNCVDIWVSGQVIDSSNNKGKANVPVRVFWDAAGYCIFCSEIEVGKNKTDAAGNFHFNVRIDSTWFRDYVLKVEIPMPGGYIGDERYGPERLNCFLVWYNPSGLQNIRFVIYQRANLTIKLTRTSIAPFIYFEMGYVYGSTHNGLYVSDGSSPLASIDFNVPAAANLYTKVDWRKATAPGQSTYFKDSIKCTMAGNNVLNVSY